jgi:tRNA (adenine57-N1/adenine58-N1)-methyltransferase
MKTAREKARRIRVEKGMAADPGGVNLEMELGEMLKEELSKDAGTTEEVVVVPGLSNKRKAEDLSAASGEAPVKKSKVDDLIQTDKTPLPPITTTETASTSAPPKTRSPKQPRIDTLSSQLLLRISPEMRGHTSYLTFATYYPVDIREAITAQSGRATKATSPVPAAPTALAAPEPAKASTSGTKQAPISVVETETDTEYGDPAMEAAIGTLTEEEMIGLLGA